MLADVQAGSARADGFKITPIFHRRIRLHIKALLLRQSATEEDVNHRFRPRGLRRRSHGLKSAEMIHAQSEQTYGTGLDHVATGNGVV